MSFSHVQAYLVLLGLPTLFFVLWIGCWVFFRRVSPWFLVAATAVSTAHIVVAWTMTRGSGPAVEGNQDIITFYAALANGITGMVSVVVLAAATALIAWIRPRIRSRAAVGRST